MSLATRCTTCGTVFRVVQDQLKVSEGWVRCGRCDEVFNAMSGLFDLERDAPPTWTPPAAPPQPSAAAFTESFQAQAEPPDDDEIFQLSDDDRIHSRFFQPEQEDVDLSPAEAVSERDRVDFADARFNTALLTSEGIADERKRPRSRRAALKKARAKSAARARPDFVQQAKLQERWRRPAVRAALSACVLVLALALLGQWVYHFRDLVSAQWPATRPWLASVCGALNCKLGLPRRIDDIAVDSSSLSPVNAGAAYRLSVALRNRSSLPLAVPWIDLALTDPGGQLVARKALSGADFRADPAALVAHGEANLQAVLLVEGRRVSGYTVEIFYP